MMILSYFIQNIEMFNIKILKINNSNYLKKQMPSKIYIMYSINEYLNSYKYASSCNDYFYKSISYNFSDY